MRSDSPIQFSIVVPFYNEQENIPPLYMKLTEVLDGIGEPYELVFVDDGSKDNSFKVLSDIYEHDCRENHGDSHRESPAQKRAIELRHWADDSRVSGFTDGEIFVGLFDAAAAIFRPIRDGRSRAGFLAWRLSGVRKVLQPQGHHDGAWATDAAGGGAVHQWRAVYLHGLARRDHRANLLRIAEQADLCAARSEEPSKRDGRFHGINASFGQPRSITASRHRTISCDPQN